MAPSARKKPAPHPPGQPFTVEQEEYIIDLKEVAPPAPDWSTLTHEFNRHFPDAQRSKGGLQVHYSRSLKPGRDRRPSSRPIPTTLGGGSAGASTTAPAANKGKGSDTEDADFIDQAAVNTLHPSSTSLTKLASSRRHPRRAGTSDNLLRIASDRNSAFYRDVEKILDTPRVRRATKRSYADFEDDKNSDEDLEHDSNKKTHRRNNQLDVKDQSQGGESASDESELSSVPDEPPVRETIETSQPRMKQIVIKLRSSMRNSATVTPTTPAGRPNLKQSSRLRERAETESGSESPVRPDWEVCTAGHKEWEKRRLDPDMPYIIRQPGENRIVEWNSKSKSLRCRSRRDGDPDPRLTKGGPLLKAPLAGAKSKFSVSSRRTSIRGTTGSQLTKSVNDADTATDEQSARTASSDRSVSSPNEEQH